MSKINDGGPAYPTAIAAGPGGDVYGSGFVGSDGMPLRDAIAMRMPGFDAECSTEYAATHLDWMKPPYNADINWADWWAAANAAKRYRKADAMLRARESLADPFAEDES